MTTRISRAGLMLGVIGLAMSGAARAEDYRGAQALLESGIFLGQAQADAIYGRLDAVRPPSPTPVPGTAAYWESSGVGFGQAERAGRFGWGADSTHMRLGLEREISQGVVAGLAGAFGFGGVGSGDVGSRTASQHLDVYARRDSGPSFVKTLVGVSRIGFLDVTRGPGELQSHGETESYGVRAGGQAGVGFRFAGVKISPSVSFTAIGQRLSGYDESGGTDATRFAARNAAAAIGAARLSGAKAIPIGGGQKVDLSAFVGADEVLAFGASDLRTDAADGRGVTRVSGAPNGRGLVGGVGVGTKLPDGVTINLNYDYSLRDNISTRSGHARLAVAF